MSNFNDPKRQGFQLGVYNKQAGQEISRFLANYFYPSLCAIDALGLNKLTFDKNGKADLGKLTNKYHEK